MADNGVAYPGVCRQLRAPVQRVTQTPGRPHEVFSEIPSHEVTPGADSVDCNNNVIQSDNYFHLDWVVNKPNDISRKANSGATRAKFESRSGHKSRRINRNKNSLSSYLGISTGFHLTKMSRADTSRAETSHVGFKLIDDSDVLDTNDELNTPNTDFYDGPNLDGQLTDGTPETKQRLSEDYNQLDEPILDTLMRDLTSIYNKMKIVSLPLSSYDIYKIVLRGWDLWGPLLLCTFLSFNLHHSELDNSSGFHFADVFVLIWFGSAVISLNYRLLSISSAHSQFTPTSTPQSSQVLSQASPDELNSRILEEGIKSVSDRHHTLVAPPTLLQLMCVFGYCLVAPCVGLILLKIITLERLLFERVLVGLIFGFAWPTYCSIRILIRYQHPSKRALAIYPIGFFYLVLSCLMILNH